MFQIDIIAVRTDLQITLNNNGAQVLSMKVIVSVCMAINIQTLLKLRSYRILFLVFCVHFINCNQFKVDLCVSMFQELRMVLQEHEWNVDDALHVLQMFSDSGGSGFLRPVCCGCHTLIFAHSRAVFLPLCRQYQLQLPRGGRKEAQELQE